MTPLTETQMRAIRDARSIAASAEQALRRRAGDGARARPSLNDVNSTLSRLESIQALLKLALEG